MWVEADVVSGVPHGTVFADGNKCFYKRKSKKNIVKSISKCDIHEMKYNKLYLQYKEAKNGKLARIYQSL